MGVSADVARVLTEVRVAELITVAKDEGVRVRPMSAVWLPDREEFVLTTPPAYPEKVREIRRDGRVALLFSDFSGSGLDQSGAILVRGRATAPEVVAAPQEVPEYWQEMRRRHPSVFAEMENTDKQKLMAWYYLRLPMYIQPEEIEVLDELPAGGRLEPFPDEAAGLAERIADAVNRYPTAVFAARDETGHPTAVRAELTLSGGELTVRPGGLFGGIPGAASLLWHRHKGGSGDMLALQVIGTADSDGPAWQFTPERIPGALSDDTSADAWQGWMEDGHRRTERYLAKYDLQPAPIDWSAVTGT